MPLCILMACEGSGGQCRTGAKPKLLTPGLRISIPLKPPQPLSMEMRQGSSEGCGEAARSSGIEGTFWVPPQHTLNLLLSSLIPLLHNNPRCPWRLGLCSESGKCGHKVWKDRWCVCDSCGPHNFTQQSKLILANLLYSSPQTI
jgi:hypothetical protein